VTAATPLFALDAVVLDTETTGLDARTARVVQIGAVRLAQGALDAARRFESLFDPGVAIPKASTAVHGITDAMVSGAPKFAQVAESLEAFVGGAIVIGHAIAYDLAVLRREYGLAGRAWPNFQGLDVRLLARVALPSLADQSLDRLCDRLGIDIEARHTAVGDAVATARAFLALVPLLRAKNVRTLAEAEAASRAIAERDAPAAGGTLAAATLANATLVPGPRALLRGDSFPYRHLVRDVMSAPPIFAPPEATVRSAIRLMIEKGVSSVFVRAASGDVGIFTERDALRAVNSRGEAALALQVDALMSAPLLTVRDDDFVYRAIGRTDRLGVRHLGVSDRAGEIVGALTTRNLLRHRVVAAMILGDEIERAAKPADLAMTWARVPEMARTLMQEDVDPRLVAGVVSAEICGMTRRAAELAEAELRGEGAGGPPVAYAVLVLGSAGRGESQLAADQDNAIVYAEGREGGAEDAYFAKLAARMNDILDAAGIPNCKGGVMAKNRLWRKSVADWRDTIDGWVRRQRPEDLLNVDIFFDAVPVHGETSLGEAVWEYAYAHAHPARDFQNLLIEVARNPVSPFTLLGGFRLEAGKRLDIKRTGLMPIFTAARVLSIRHAVRARSTADRLNGFVAKDARFADVVESVLDAHRVLLGASISQQVADTAAGVPLSTRVDVGRLTRPARSRLKEALKVVPDAIDLVSEGRI
jgi:DNA polymerase-3 subunit epsilon/CBS domain-containing protein